MPQNGSGQPTLITLHDAVTDSPVYRANVLHFDEQVDLLEKWLDSLSRHLKQYTDKLNKFNLETNNVCKRTIPTGIDDTLIDSNFTGAVIRSFSDALQTSLAFKTKLVSDLEDNFIQPLAQFVKTHLKEYKEFRKQHEKALERYEAQLYKYTSQSKTKEASALREEAFRLHEARKQYSRMSGQHVIRILQFRSQLEHCLVDSFSSATLAHMHECEGGQQVWQKLDASLVSWKQWLIDDRNTCNYQLHNLYTARQQLQAEFLQKVHPPRDLEKYAPLGTVPAGSSMGSRQSLDFTMTQSDENHPSFKWGYLFTRVSRLSWTRKWFFLFDGYFGTCHIHTTGKLKGAITVTEKVSVLLCDIKPIVDGDRRFCFEIVCAQQPSFVLQAETEEEMREWMGAFVSAKRSSVDSEHMNNKDSPRPSSPANERVSDASSISLATTNGSVEQQDSSVVMLSTSYDKGNISLSTSTSLTPLLVCEAARQQINANSSSSMPNSSATPNQSVTSSIINLSAQNNNSNSSNSNASSSWGIPWTLVPSMFSAGSSDDSDRSPASPMSPTFPSTTGASEYDGHPVVWPLRTDDNNAPKTNMTGYTTVLETRNSELRNLFGGVSPSEVVVEAFIGSLKKKPTTQEDEKVPSPTTPTTSADASEQELRAQLAGPAAPPTSEFGYAYTGRVFVTQDTFWFYSCVLMTCVNTVAVRLKDIKNIRLIRDQSASETIGKNGKPRNIVLAIDLVQSNQSPLIISTLLDDIEVVAERLRIAVESAKSSSPMPLQVMYDVMRNISASAGKNKSNQKTTLSKTEHHPLKAHSTPDLHAASNAVPSASSSTTTTTTTTSNTADIYHPEPVGSPIPDKKKRKPRKSSGSNKPVPKTGALAAAMMAATVAGGSGFFDVDKITKLEEAAKQKPDSSVSDPLIELGAIEPKDASVPKTSSPVDPTHSAPEDTTAIPPSVQIPSGPCACDCDSHLDKTETEVQLSVSAKQLFELMFAEGSNDIWEAKLAAAGGNGLRMGKWENVNGKQQRSLKYILPVNNPMVKLKEAEVAETQVLLKKEDYIRYVVQISTKTTQLPHADAFIPSIRYCITWVSKSECKLRCSLGVQFVKSILVKGMVNKAAMKGMSESIASFIPILEKKVSKEGGKSSTSTSSSSTLSSTVEANDSKQQSAMETAVKKDAYTKQNSIDEWIDTLRNFVLDVPWHAYMAILGLLFLWMLSAWLRSGPSKDDVPHTLMSHPLPNRVTSRAVYLKDLQEGLIQPHLDEIPYANSESFQYFLANGTVDASHQWYNSNHHRMALELLFSRERVAMLRHDMLVIFQLLNQVDARLLEHEYVNWMLDTRLWCHKPNYTPPHQFCEQIQRQLQTYFK